MAFDREAARQAGYSDAEIDAYLKEERSKKAAPAPAPTAEANEPPAPTTVVPEAGGGATAAATTAGLAIAPYAVPAVGGAAAALGANKLYGAWKQSAQAAQALADAKMASEQGIAQRAAARAAPMPTTSGPVAPQLLDAAGRPLPPSGPVAPSGVAPAAAPQAAAAGEASLIDKTTAMIRQLAANKVLGNIAKGGMGLTAALMPGNAGQNYMVPQTGRMRGMEINPLTGAPWTKEQLDAYNANPNAFDAQLGAPQMPR